MALTAAQVAGVVKNTHGGPPAGTTVAQWVAKSRQESSHRPEVPDPETGTHIGLWQIGLEHARTVKEYSGIVVPQDREGFRSWLTSPLNNWLAAKALYAESGWRPWNASGGRPTPNAADNAAAANPDNSSANSGGAVDGAPEPGVVGSSVTDSLGGIVDAALDVPGQLGRLVDVLVDAAGWLSNRENWLRVAYVIGGGAVALAALNTIAKPVVDPLLDTARKVIPR